MNSLIHPIKVTSFKVRLISDICSLIICNRPVYSCDVFLILITSGCVEVLQGMKVCYDAFLVKFGFFILNHMDIYTWWLQRLYLPRYENNLNIRWPPCTVIIFWYRTCMERVLLCMTVMWHATCRWWIGEISSGARITMAIILFKTVLYTWYHEPSQLQFRTPRFPCPLLFAQFLPGSHIWDGPYNGQTTTATPTLPPIFAVSYS